VHKARVATRRLRSDLRTFRSLLDPEWTGSLRDELRRLGSILGEARDADVLLERIRSRAETLPASEAPGVAEVIEALAQRRKEAHAALIETLRGDEYTDLLDRLVDAANDPRLLPDGDRPASEVLPALVRGPWKKLRRKVKRAGKDPTPAVLHAIRIRTKRVRYAADAAGPVMGKPARRFADDAADLQTVLGNHNDAVVAETWLRGWAGADGRSRDGTFAAGVLAGVERAAAHEAAGAWRSAWKHLRRPSNRRWMA
jgi:CHAD domain-containing protein